MKFTKYITRRILQMIPVILAVTIINFLIINFAPGDPVEVLAGEMGTEEYKTELREKYGLDEPIGQRLILYLGNLMRFDLGESYKFKSPVAKIIAERMKVTLLLVLLSEMTVITVGTLIGTYIARKKDRWQDKLISNVSMIIYCFPAFWIGMLLILFFAVKLQWLPSSGMYNFRSKLPRNIDLLLHLILPSLTLMMVRLPVYIKLSRSSVIEVSQEDYMTTAVAIGYGERKVYRKFALRNALLPTVTQAGMSLSTVFSGALLTETVFSWPGMGLMIYDGVQMRDYPIIMGGFLVTTIMVVIGSFITDLVYMYLDPRVVAS